MARDCRRQGLAAVLAVAILFAALPSSEGAQKGWTLLCCSCTRFRQPMMPIFACCRPVEQCTGRAAWWRVVSYTDNPNTDPNSDIKYVVCISCCQCRSPSVRKKKLAPTVSARNFSLLALTCAPCSNDTIHHTNATSHPSCNKHAINNAGSKKYSHTSCYASGKEHGHSDHHASCHSGSKDYHYNCQGEDCQKQSDFPQLWQYRYTRLSACTTPRQQRGHAFEQRGSSGLTRSRGSSQKAANWHPRRGIITALCGYRRRP